MSAIVLMFELMFVAVYLAFMVLKLIWWLINRK